MRRMAAKAESNPPRLLDLWTIAAIAVSATVVTDFIHEGLGHGGLCVAIGAQPLALSTVHFQCSVDTRLVAAGGTLANLIFGAAFWGAARAVKQAAPWRYFFWLLMTFNLFDAGGYLLFSGIGNFGDWAAVVAGWQPPWAWRVGLVVLGTVTYFLLFVPLCLRELGPFLGKDAEIRVRRARQLTVVPYLTGGVLPCLMNFLGSEGGTGLVRCSSLTCVWVSADTIWLEELPTAATLANPKSRTLAWAAFKASAISIPSETTVSMSSAFPAMRCFSVTPFRNSIAM
jgi:hypothetical protein